MRAAVQFNDLRRAIPAVTQKSLTATLRHPVDVLLGWARGTPAIEHPRRVFDDADAGAPH